MAENEDGVNTQRTQNHLDDLSRAIGGTAGVFLGGIPTIKQAFGALGSFGGRLGEFSGYLEGQVDVYRTLTRSGVNFGGQLDQIQISATNAGLSLDQLKSTIKDNSELFAALGNTANEGAQQFLAQLASFRTAIDPSTGIRFSTQLRRLGMDFEDFAEQTAMLETLQTLSARRDQMTTEQRNQATFEFAKNLDILSKLTGKQADELQKEMSARMREGDYQAFLAGLDPDEAQAVMLAQAQAEAAGFGDLFKDYMVRGFPSEDQRMLAGMSGDMVNLFSGMRSSLQDGDMSSFGSMTDEIMVTGAATSMANRELAMLGNTTRSTSAAMQMFADASPVMAKFRQQLAQEARARGINIRDIDRATRQRIFNEAKAAAEAEQATQTSDAAAGDSRAVLNALLAGQEALVDVAAATQQAAITRLYDDFLTPGAREFGNFLNSFNTQGTVQRNLNELLDVIMGAGGTSSGPTSNVNQGTFDDFMANLGQRQGSGSAIASIQRLQDQIANATGDERARLQDELDALIQSTADQFNMTNPVVEGSGSGIDSDLEINTSGNVIVNGNIDGANNGTLGAFGNVLHDFGKESLMRVHGREAILNEQQLNNLVQGSMQMGQSMVPSLQGMLNNIRPAIQNMANQNGPQMQNVAQEMAPMMQQMAEQMRGPMEEMANSMRGPMENMAGTMRQQLNVSTRSLRATRAIPGNIFGGLKV